MSQCERLSAGGRLPTRFGALGGLIVVACGSAGAMASPVVAPDATKNPAHQTAQVSQIIETSRILEVERDLGRDLPLPVVVAPLIDADGRDPRLAGLPSDHERRFDPVRPGDPPIHIPEPASIVLLATGAVGLLARRALRRDQG